jgi:hypothetical protein
MRKHEWISDRLGDLGKTKSGMASVLGIDPARVSEVIAGKRQIQRDELIPAAAYLELSPNVLSDMLDNPPTRTAALTLPLEGTGETNNNPASRTGVEVGMSDTRLRVLRARITTLLAPLDSEAAAVLVDSIIQEKAEAEERLTRPRDRA